MPAVWSDERLRRMHSQKLHGRRCAYVVRRHQSDDSNAQACRESPRVDAPFELSNINAQC